MRLSSLVAAAALLSASVAAHATAIITFTETGGNVVATTSGSLSLTGLRLLGSSGATPGIDPAFSNVLIGGGSFDTYVGRITGPQSFGNGGFTAPSQTSGGLFGIETGGDGLLVPTGYQSGGTIVATSTFSNATFASLGITPGIYTFTLPSDTLQLNISTPPPPVAVTPEPSSLALLGTGIFGVAGVLRKRFA